MKKIYFAILIALTITGIGLAANAAVITFDDLSATGAGTQISNGYKGFNWNNMYFFDPSLYNPSGYQNGTVSGPNVAFNGFGDPADIAASSSTTFDFNGAYLTAAWMDGLNIEVKGYNGANLLYDTTVVVDSTSPTWEQFNYFGITSLNFSSFGGTAHGYESFGEQFAMDNFTYNSSVPEPSMFLLFGCGMIGLVTMWR